MQHLQLNMVNVYIIAFNLFQGFRTNTIIEKIVYLLISA